MSVGGKNMPAFSVQFTYDNRLDANKITSDVEVIPIQQVNEAYERVMKGQVKYRFVIDIASLKQS